MINGITVTGLQKVQRQLNKDLKDRAKDLSYKGLVRAGLVICRDAVKGAPVDTGNLRASSYVIGKSTKGGVNVKKLATGKKEKGVREVAQVLANFADRTARLSSLDATIAVEVGFTASYAEAVHEGNPMLNWNKGGPQFLRNSVILHYADILRLVTEEVRKI